MLQKQLHKSLLTATLGLLPVMLRQKLFIICGVISFTQWCLRHACSFAPCIIDFLNKTDQREKVFDPEKCAPGRKNYKWVFRPNVRPLDRHGGSTPFRVEKENATPTCDSSYAIDFKLGISIGMEWMDDPEGFVVKILIRRS